jgi:O-acetyl-ADP-ribose deacetylase (regulator of RNase III)
MKTLIRLVQGDITQIAVDGIVNAANSALSGGGGVDGAIHQVGGPIIRAECRKIKGGCPVGSAVSTAAGNLPAKRVIHAVGPVWQGGHKQEAKLKTISFPAISTGAYGYPIQEACRVALTAVLGHLEWETILEEVIFVLYSPAAYRVYEQTLQELTGREPE